MEHYGADPRPPLQKVLEDVERNCDVYIGIFGRRYGWVPPGSTQSITEQEYRQARRAGKVILIFLLEEDAQGWSEPEAEPAEHKTQLANLREELSKEFLPAKFSSCDELALKVISALANLNAPRQTLADAEREDDLLGRVRANDGATVSQSEQALVNMGSAAYAALLRERLRKGRKTPRQRMQEVEQLAAIAQRNYGVMPILRNLLGAEDPATRAAVVFKIAEHASMFERITDDDVRAILALSSDGSTDVRREVGHAMWKFLPREEAVKNEMVNKLITLARLDPDEGVRKVAGYSLSRVGRGY
jgi:hypothetical protein